MRKILKELESAGDAGPSNSSTGGGGVPSGLETNSVGANATSRSDPINEDAAMKVQEVQDLVKAVDDIELHVGGLSGEAATDDIVDGNNAIFSEDFFLNFYRIVAQTPLPADSFNPKNISITKLNEIENAQERQVTMLALVQELVFYDRLDTWNRRFCESGFSSRMCRQDAELIAIAQNSGYVISPDDVSIKAVPVEPVTPPPSPPKKIPTVRLQNDCGRNNTIREEIICLSFPR
ncbi:hypothetical protein [Loktanella salsilacus]|uniref:hypothetical protein n=1 Tax=Loktanella salsilacus TaxID=195913 RepID=UPI0015877603|nr:hypothetical protein [Loktanella salsilacus]